MRATFATAILATTTSVSAQWYGPGAIPVPEQAYNFDRFWLCSGPCCTAQNAESGKSIERYDGAGVNQTYLIGNGAGQSTSTNPATVPNTEEIAQIIEENNLDVTEPVANEPVTSEPSAPSFIEQEVKCYQRS